MPSHAAAAAPRGAPEQVRLLIERFLAAGRRPALIEPGEDPLPLIDDHYALETRNGHAVLQAWDETRNLVRRILEVVAERPGRLELLVQRFGMPPGAVLVVDLARADNRDAGLRGLRLVFRERFRCFLSRQFPGWRIAELSAEQDLEHSLSPAYPRALLRRGAAGWAAIGVPPETTADGVLSFGLIWLDYLRRRERRLTLEGLILFLPAGEETTTCLRLQYMNPQLARFLVFVHSDADEEGQVDPADRGNLQTRLETWRAPSPRNDDIMGRLCRLPQVHRLQICDGSVSLRVRGLEFARVTGDDLLFGLHRKRVAGQIHMPEIEALATEIARVRAPDARDREHPLYLRHPEAWLESQVREQMETVDPTLAPAPVYGQVPAFAGVDRGLLDLLAVDRAGRLAVLELKATADLHLPLQALDYWMRVRWHAARGEFAARGYFPGIELDTRDPRLLLISPALEFHPTTEVILRYFSPALEVERIGLAAPWRSQLRVMFRAAGARSPMR